MASDDELPAPDLFVPDTSLKSPLRNVTTVQITTGEDVPKEYRKELDSVVHLVGYRYYWSTDIHRCIPILMNCRRLLDPADLSEVNISLTNMRHLLAPLNVELPPSDAILGFSLLTRQTRSLAYSFVRGVTKTTDSLVKNRTIIPEMRKFIPYIERVGDVVLVFTDNFLFVKDTENVWIADRDSMLMLSDLMIQRAMISEILHVASVLGVDTYPTLDTVEKYWKSGDDLLGAAGNSAYKALKMWEALVVGRMQCVTDNRIVDSTWFYDNMKKEYISILRDLQCGHMSWCTQLEQAVNVDHLGALFCMNRMWGHPFVFTELSLHRNRKIACPEKLIDQGPLDDLRATFVMMICEGYYQKRKRWPKLDISMLPKKSEVRRAVLSNDSVDKLSSHYNKFDWNLVHAHKTFDAGDNLNILSVMSDKACSPRLPDLIQNCKRKSKGKWHDRRVLAVWLNSELVSSSEILKDIDANGIHEWDLLIGVVDKERELAEAGRLFSLMPLRLKLYFGLTEALLARDVVPLVPQCTMTDSLQELMEKQIAATTKGQRVKQIVPVHVSIDFEKWNMQFRKRTTEGCFSFLDELFGFKTLYRDTHSIFEKTRFYCSNGINYPTVQNGKIVDDNWSWTGQQGGCEGLRQKGWTLITIAGLKRVLDQEHIEFSILGQGDNQVITLYFPTPEGKNRDELEEDDIRRLRNRVVRVRERIFSAFAQLKMPIKAEETWMSASVFSYGKYLIVDGRPLCTSLKKLPRMFHFSNEDYPSWFTTLATISATAQAGVATDRHLLVSYVVCCFEVARALKWHMRHSLLIGDWNRALRQGRVWSGGATVLMGPAHLEMVEKFNRMLFATLLGCSTLGGAPFQCPYGFLSRGVSDPLSMELSYLYDVLKTTSGWRAKIVYNLLRPVLSKKVDLKMLFQDPLSINLSSSVRADSVLKSAASKILERAHNPLVQQYLRVKAQDEDIIVNYLATMSPLSPKIASDILAATVSGQCYSLLGRFEGTRTLVKLVRQSNINLWDKIKKAECGQLTAMINQWCVAGDSRPGPCPSKYAQTLRTSSWGIEVEGVTVPYALHLMDFHPLKERVCSECPRYAGYIEYGLDSSVTTDTNTLFKRIGPLAPYLGSETGEKLASASEYQKPPVPAAVHAAASNLRMIGWFIQPDSNLADFLRQIFASYTDAPPALFETCGVEVAGNWIHRHRDRKTKHGGFISCNYTGPTHVSVNTNKMGKYSKGTENYPLHFQSICVSHLHVLFLWYDQRRLTGPLVHAHVRCEECLPILSSQAADAGPNPPQLTQSKISGLWVDKQSILESTRIDSVALTYTSWESVANPLLFAHSIVARECVKSVLGSQHAVAMNWFFRIDPSLLAPFIIQQLMIRLISMKIAHRFQLNVEQSEVEWILDNWKAYLCSLSGDSFGGLVTMYMDQNWAEKLQSSIASEAIPETYPPTKSSITNAIKRYLSADWDIPTGGFCIAWKEMTPFQLLEYCVSAYMWTSCQGMAGGERKVLKAVRREMANCSMNLDERIDLIGILTSQMILNPKLTHSSRVWLEGLIKFIQEDVVFVSALPEVCVKSLPELPVRINPAAHARVDVEKLEKAASSLSVYVGRGDVMLRGELMHSSGRSLSTVLATDHGLFTLLMLSQCSKELDLRKPLIIGDGSGGTSLAHDRIFPGVHWFLTQYIGEQGSLPSFASSTPPEWVKHGGSGETSVLLHVWSDFTSETNLKKLFEERWTYIFVDTDFIRHDLSTGIENILKNAYCTSVLFLLPSISSGALKLLAGLCRIYGKIWVFEAAIDSETRHGILVSRDHTSVSHDTKLVPIIFLGHSTASPISMSVVETYICRSPVWCLHQYSDTFSWVKWRDETYALRKLLQETWKVLSSSHVTRKGSSVNVTQAYIGTGNAPMYFVVCYFLSLCGEVEERISKISEGGVLIVTESNPGYELHVCCGDRTRLNDLIAIRRRTSSKSYFYYIDHVDVMRALHPLRKVWRYCLYTGGLDHRIHDGNCSKFGIKSSMRDKEILTYLRHMSPLPGL